MKHPWIFFFVVGSPVWISVIYIVVTEELKYKRDMAAYNKLTKQDAQKKHDKC